MENFWIALGLTTFAGMATGVGSLIAFTAKRTNYRFLSVGTAFAAGVMLYISFVEIFPEGVEFLSEKYGEYWGNWVNVAAFFGGVVLIGAIDRLIPAAENPHEIHPEAEIKPLHDPEAPVPDFAGAATQTESPRPDVFHNHRVNEGKLHRTGLLTALAIAIHNFPEGLVTFLAALEDPTLGLAIAVAIALHNIPEGISISVPIFYATGDRRKAFLYSFFSGLAEPAGALVAYAGLRLFLGNGNDAFPPQVMGVLYAGVAGIMVYISLDELLPTSKAYGKGHDSLYGLVGGMAVMALSLLLLQ